MRPFALLCIPLRLIIISAVFCCVQISVYMIYIYKIQPKAFIVRCQSRVLCTFNHKPETPKEGKSIKTERKQNNDRRITQTNTGK